MIKFDYNKFMDDNVDCRGLFKQDSVLEKCEITFYQRTRGYNVILGNRLVLPPNENRKRERLLVYNIIISQDGLKLDVYEDTISRNTTYLIEIVNDAVPKMLLISDELKKYSFEAAVYALLEDNPGIPYYFQKDDPDIKLFKDAIHFIDGEDNGPASNSNRD